MEARICRISAVVGSSSNEMQSQRIFPSGVWTSRARCPMANFGSVPIPIKLGSCSLKILWNPSACICASVVHCCPLCPTYWRASWQIGHPGGGVSRGGNCVPHVWQIHFSIVKLLFYEQSLVGYIVSQYMISTMNGLWW